jgi:hypothetical protein
VSYTLANIISPKRTSFRVRTGCAEVMGNADCPPRRHRDGYFFALGEATNWQQRRAELPKVSKPTKFAESSLTREQSPPAW